MEFLFRARSREVRLAEPYGRFAKAVRCGDCVVPAEVMWQQQKWTNRSNGIGPVVIGEVNQGGGQAVCSGVEGDWIVQVA